MMEKSKLWDLFNFIESKKGIKVPLITKIVNFPEKITKEDLNIDEMIVHYHRVQLKNGMLPDNMTVKNSLYLSNQKNLTKLPNNLTVDILTITDTPIDDLPNGLVCSALFCGNTPLALKYTDEQIYKMSKEKGGIIYRISRNNTDLNTVSTREELYKHFGWD